MKKSNFRLSCLAFALMALPVVANAAPEISGRLYLGVNAEEVKTTETNTVTGDVATSKTNRPTMGSMGSRIRVEGSEKLTEQTDLDYFLEYRIFVDYQGDKPDEGPQYNFRPRDTYIALNNKKYGELRFGNHLTIDTDIDYVDESYYDSKSSGVPFSYDGVRASNTIVYYSPRKNNWQLMAQYGMDENSEGNRGGLLEVFKDGRLQDAPHEFAVVGFNHEVEDKSYFGATYTKGGEFSSIRATAWYRPTEKSSVGVMAQQVDYRSGNDELGVLASTTYRITDPLMAWAQVGYTDNYYGYKDADKTMVNVGLLRNVGENLKVYGALGYAKGTEFSTNDDDELVKESYKSKAVEAGVVYYF